MSQELVDSIVDAMPIVEDCAYITDNSIAFRGKNLDAWTKEIRMTLLHDKMSYAEIQAYNYEFVRVNEIIMNNLAYAKAYYALKLAQNRMIATINADKTKKMLGADSLERFASLECATESMALQMASLFYEYWKTQCDKMKMLDSRLQNINYMVRN